MILGFKKQFVDPIKNGSKIHSIREDKHDRWKTGNIIHFATGVRTKEYNQFHEGKCISTQKIEIIYNNPFRQNPKSSCFIVVEDNGDEFKDMVVTVFVDGLPQARPYVMMLAKNDGFDSLEDFFKWFNKDFKGKIIHWTDFKY